MLTAYFKSYYKYWHGYVRLFTGEDPNFGLILVSCVGTLPLNMMNSLPRRFFFCGGGGRPITKFDYSPFLPNVVPFDFWLLTELKTALSRPEIF